MMIAHIDMDAFYASVEMRDHPQWRTKPLVVGYAGPRGVVAAASYQARRYGIFSAMPISKALRQCPDLLVVAPRFSLYEEISQDLLRLYAEYTERVEPLALDEAYLDLSQYKVPGRIVSEIRSRIAKQLHLPASAGIGPNKYVAKVASGRAKPEGQLLVEQESVLSFLWPLPVAKLWGVGPITAAKLNQFGLFTIEQVAKSSVQELNSLLGRCAADLHRLAWGQDEREVEPEAIIKSLSCEHTFDYDCDEVEELARVLQAQADHLQQRLTSQKLRAGQVVLKVRWPDFKTETRTLKIAPGEALAWLALEHLQMRLRLKGQPVRLLGLAVSKFVSDDSPLQLELFSQ